MNIRYFEIEKPYYALIKAVDEEELKRIYFENIKRLTDEDLIPEKYREVEKEYAIANVTIATTVQMYERKSFLGFIDMEKVVEQTLGLFNSNEKVLLLDGNIL